MPPDPEDPPKQPSRLAPDDPREWLNRARGNLTRAHAISPGVYLEDLCFDAQQAAEKAVKAVLLARNVDFPYTHDLARLLTLLDAGGIGMPDELRSMVRLTRYAVATRYPGAAEAVTSEEHRAAVRIAEDVLAWAEQQAGE